MEGTKRMIILSNQKNAMFVGRKDILWKFADRKVSEIKGRFRRRFYQRDF